MFELLNNHAVAHHFHRFFAEISDGQKRPIILMRAIYCMPINQTRRQAYVKLKRQLKQKYPSLKLRLAKSSKWPGWFTLKA